MNEEEIDTVVEMSRDALFRELQEGKFTKREYDMAIKALEVWAKDQYEMLRRTLH